MKLDRNIEGNKGRGKYALLLIRHLTTLEPDTEVDAALRVLDDAGLLDWGTTPETEFFVMRLKDRYAAGGLSGYAAAAANDDDEYAREVWNLSQRAGPHHPLCKKPD